MSPEDLLKLTTATLSPKMLGIRIVSHKEYRVGDKVFTSYRAAEDFLRSDRKG